MSDRRSRAYIHSSMPRRVPYGFKYTKNALAAENVRIQQYNTGAYNVPQNSRFKKRPEENGKGEWKERKAGRKGMG